MASAPLLCSYDQKYENIVYSGKKYSVTVITQENYPKAYAWYQSMIKKYPEADLDQYSFVVGSLGWCMYPAQFIESKKALIGCPYHKLYENSDFDTWDEYALLHEAGHAHNHQNWALLFQGGRDITTLSKIATVAALVAAGGHTYNQNYFGLQEKTDYDPYLLTKKGATVTGLAAAGIGAYYALTEAQIIAWRKIDERYADKFANNHADYHALEGGMNYFQNRVYYDRSFKDMLWRAIFAKSYFEYYPGFTGKIKAILNAYTNSFNEILLHLSAEHPSYESRANQARNVLQKRFPNNVALA
jgi:hypothetical protein